ncbi:MAG: hypothetical protein L6R42_004444 [Xanthoria sp. 1 TBL-2021]|nr:MAG: hypothetical protein L6R42_004444 [Xanthoria sp. 1 TBL-2021]
MICTPCLRLLPTSTPLRRLFYSTSRSPPPATSTSAAQPFSTPFTPSPYPSTSPTHPQKHPSSAKSTAQQQPVQSSLKAGTLLKGLAFEKNKEPPVAREDAEYPDWLWGLLGKGGVSGEEGGKGGGDAFSKSAKQRRLASRLARQGGSTSSTSPSTSDIIAPEVPIYTQSIDLPAVNGGYKGREVDLADVEKARRAREELTAAMRGKRRKGIKEGNFLRGMR